MRYHSDSPRSPHPRGESGRLGHGENGSQQENELPHESRFPPAQEATERTLAHTHTHVRTYCGTCGTEKFDYSDPCSLPLLAAVRARQVDERFKDFFGGAKGPIHIRVAYIIPAEAHPYRRTHRRGGFILFSVLLCFGKAHTVWQLVEKVQEATVRLCCGGEFFTGKIGWLAVAVSGSPLGDPTSQPE